MEISRDIYLERLKRRRGNHLVKVITGVRRCGKSYLLFQLFKRLLLEEGIPADHIIEIEFDRRRNARLRNPDEACKYIDSLLRDEKPYYLFLDEVQFLEDFESVLNDYLHIENLDIYVTGSNSRFLSSDILTEFRGRGDEVHIFPLSYKEFSQSFQGAREDAWQEYLMFGGLPLLLSKETDEEKSEYLKNLAHQVF